MISTLADPAETALLYQCPEASGSWNMAFDQMLLETADQDASASVRFYSWDAPTLSLGYFQKFCDRESHRSSLKCPVVRRSSGGGAILHHRELTFSIALPSSNRWSKENNKLYHTVHGAILNALKQWGVDASEFEKTEKIAEAPSRASILKSREVNDRAFLCFQRRTGGDIVLNGNKVGGSAQRRSRNAILQHTSLLWQRSESAPELLGVKDLGDIDCSMNQFQRTLIEQLGKSLLVAFKPAVVSERQKKIIFNISEKTYGNSQWLHKK